MAFSVDAVMAILLLINVLFPNNYICFLPSGDSPSNQGISFTNNKSERFESRFVSVKIAKSCSIMLQGMEDSILGVWVAHGEGKLHQ